MAREKGFTPISAERLQTLVKLVATATKIRDGFTYDPGHSDLDNEQPIHIRATLGDWRMLDYTLRSLEVK